jgi:hypothetical protein
VDNAVTGTISGPVFLEGLKEAGATPDKVKDYIKHFSKCRSQAVTNSTNSRGAQLPPDVSIAPNQIDAATSVAWALLCAKVNHLQPMSLQDTPIHARSLSDEIANLLGLSNIKRGILASVLAKAPHMSKLSDPMVTNPHLEKTQDSLLVYSPQNSQDILVNKTQFAPVGDPLPCTIWHKILLDHFVDFEKLFASMDKGYNHHDNPKDFGAGYALVKEDQAFSKHPLCTEARIGFAFFFSH